MNTEGITKAPKDKNCPYCGQAFTSSSLGRHLDLYIKSKNPKAPDGIHNVEEIRRIRGSITRRQPRGGSRRDTSAVGDSQSGSKRSPVASDLDSVSARSPGTPTEALTAKDHSKGLATYASRVEVTRIVNEFPEAGDGNAGSDATQRPNNQRVFGRQALKSSVEIRQRVQDALDTAKAAELALREMISSWRAAKQQIDLKSTPFDFNPLSLDFPALCLQCLEPPPTLFSSTQHPTSTSWSITPPGEQQHEALMLYFDEEFRKWKIACSATTSKIMDEVTYPPYQSAIQHENTTHVVQKAEESADTLQRQVTEHLASAFYVWNQLPLSRQQELWIVEMARSIGRKQKQVESLREVQHSLKQENTNLKLQIDHLNRQQQPREYKIVPPMTLKVDERMIELWTEAGADGRRAMGINMGDRNSDLNSLVAGAIERWKSVIVSSRAATGLNAQRPLDQTSAPLKTPTSSTQPPSPLVSRASKQQFQPSSNPQYHQPSPNVPNYSSSTGLRQTSLSPAGHTVTTISNPRASTASTPAQSSSDLDEIEEDAEGDADEDVDADADADADADIEMQGEPQYLSAANTSTHHGIPQLPQHEPRQEHQMHVTRSGSQQMAAPRQDPYPPRSGSYGALGVLPSQQMHMAQQTFGHQLQNLEHHLGHAHGGVNMGWNHP